MKVSVAVGGTDNTADTGASIAECPAAMARVAASCASLTSMWNSQ